MTNTAFEMLVKLDVLVTLVVDQRRAMAKNPVDHPYGGGEGAQPRGTRRPKTKYGKTTGGHKTRTPKNTCQTYIVSRRVSPKTRVSVDLSRKPDK